MLDNENYREEAISNYYKKEKEFWLNRLEGKLVKAVFPYDFGESNRETKDREDIIEEVTYRIPHELFIKITGLSNKSDFRMHVILTAVLVILLNKYTGETDIIVGAPTLRQDADLKFINTTLILRNRVDNHKTFKEFLLQVWQTMMEAVENVNFPMRTLLYQLKLQTEEDTFPLFDVGILLENIHDKSYLGDIRLNLVFNFRKTDAYIECKVEYNSLLYDPATVEKIIAHFNWVTEQVCRDINLEIGKIDMLTGEEKKQLMEFNHTAASYPGEKTVIRLFEEQVRKTPDNIALIDMEERDGTLTYRQLNEESCRLAHHLRQLGVKPETIVALESEISIETVASIMGILMAGGAYLPIDSEYPDMRKKYILEDSQAELLLTDNQSVKSLDWNGRIFEISNIGLEAGKSNGIEPVNIQAGPSQLAYIIYTSGSTGTPKGVMVEHRGLVNYLWWAARKYVKNEKEKFPLYTSISFDLTVTSIFVPLIVGNTIVLYRMKENKFSIDRIVDENNVSIIKLTPSHSKLIREKKIDIHTSNVKCLIVGGEKFEISLARDIYNNWGGRIELYNEYGPTEAVVGCMIYRYKPGKVRGGSVPIGKPINNVQIHMLDKYLRPVPPGGLGEIYIGGDCVARGYLNKPVLTAEKFITSQFSLHTSRLYKTGDLARWLPDGNIEFLGRIDHQVKIRGYRIEPEEIESRLSAQPGIKEAVVSAREDRGRDKYLCAYIIANGEFEVSELREALSGELPGYMIPSYFVPIDRIPLTPNGKIDEKALPEPEIKGGGEPYEAPRDEVEKILAELWEQVLGVPNAGINDNFFYSGGHSLKAMTFISNVHKRLNVEIPIGELFKHPTIKEISRHIRNCRENVYSSIDTVEKREYYPLSSAQLRMTVLDDLGENSIAYNVPIVMELEGNLDTIRWENALKRLINRHESFRTSFHLVNDLPIQKVHDEVEFEFEYYDLAAGDRQEKPGVLETECCTVADLLTDFIRPFDLSRAPLLRVGLIPLPRLEGHLSKDGNSENRHILMVDMHHIISDGVSSSIVIKDFMKLYMGEQLSPLRLQYKDFSEWKNREEQKKSFEIQKQYWLKEFEGEIPLLYIQLDYPRPSYQRFEGNSIRFGVNKEEIDALNTLAIQEGTTLYTVLLALFYVLLSNVSGQEDIIVGTPVAGRRHTDLEQVIGMFVNTLALRNYPKGGERFTDFLQRVKENTLKAFENQDYPFEDLVEQIEVDRDVSRNPLFDVMFVLQNIDFPQIEIPALTLRHYEYELKVSKFDLTLQAVELDDKLLFAFEYCTKLFKKKTIERFISFYKKIISSILNNPNTRIFQLEIVSDEEKKQILFDFNGTEAGYPEKKTIHELFEEQVERTPDNVALVGQSVACGAQYEDERRSALRTVRCELTYKEVKEKSNQLAHLLQTKNVKHDTIVAIMMERSVEMIIGIMGILKAGGAYLPIEPGYPEERIRYMLADSSAKALVTTNLLIEDRKIGRGEVGKNLEIVIFDSSAFPSTHLHLLPVPVSSMVYVIYTSGSTGKPKGVMVEHRNLTAYIHAFYREFELTSADTILQQASFTFDAFAEEVYPILLTGGKLAIPTKNEILDIDVLVEFIADYQITLISCSPLLLNELNLQHGKINTIHTFISGGDTLKRVHVDNLLKFGNVYNTYGPTETTVCATYYKCPEGTDPLIPIGKPISNYIVLILGKHDRLAPIGIPGELCAAGRGVTRGYLNNPELTADKFRKTIMSPSSESNKLFPNDKCPMTNNRLYFTGDLVRWLPDGNIEFLGRSDLQVKIRGFRIELGEIECHLLSHSEITEAVVVPKEDNKGNIYLCAYFVSNKEFTVTALRSYLSGGLPNYMLPSHFIPIEKIPLTPNGKVDRKRLPEPGTMNLGNHMVYFGPRNAIEKKLTEVWQKVLGIDIISINDNFFEIGGDSIKTIQIISRMKKTGYKIEMRDIFQNPQISALVPLVKKIERTADQSVITGTIPLTPIQKEFFKNSLIDMHHFNQTVMIYFEWGIETEIVKTIFLKLQEHHDALRMIYMKTNDGFVQVNQGLAHPFSIQVFDYRDRNDAKSLIEGKAQEIQASINLETGPLMKLGLFHLDDGDRLLIAIHHLVIDGVSWRILFEDIETLYRQYEKGKPLTLPLKTDSFKVWAEELSLYADSDIFLKEKAYWVELESKQIEVMEKDFPDEGNYIKDVETVSFTLNEKETDLLLTKANEAFGTEINDILVTAMGLAIKRSFGIEQLLIAMEGHGREEILKDIDVNRTVGWFTSLYPIPLDFSYESGETVDRNLSRQIKEVKECLRHMPHKGIGYGILKYLTKDENKRGINFSIKPQVILNYLGQFDEDLEKKPFEIAQESAGKTYSIKQQREFEIEVSGMITGKRLTISIYYSMKQYKRVTIEKMLNHFKRELTHIITYCSLRDGRALTPSDFIYTGLSIETLEQLQRKYSYMIEDIYTLTPMQEGMLFHALFENNKRTAYFEQISYRLQGEINVQLMEKSLNELFKRHDVLRTVFIHEGLDRPLQVVLKERNVDFCFEGLRETLSDSESKERLVGEFREKDRQRPFDLSEGVLMRVAVQQLDDVEYQVTWSSHHILMDGWCIGILIAEFLEIYTGCMEGNRAFQLPTVKPYRNYIQWLEKQNKEASRSYWALYLDSYEEAARIPTLNGIKTPEREYKNERFSVVLNKERTNGLNKLAGRHNVTVNTIIQSVWGIVLGKYNGKEDVVFGSVVSGRPSALDGVETMVGLFINTIPVRIRYEAGTAFNELLHQVLKAAIDSEPHHYYPLAEIQSESVLKQNLLNHILIFENYPVAEKLDILISNDQVKGVKEKLRISHVEAFEQTNYDFNLIILPQHQLTIRFEYNTNVYAPEFVIRITDHIKHLIDQILDNDARIIGELTLVTEEEKKRILCDFNDTEAEGPKRKILHRLFEEQVERTPNNIAVVFDDAHLTYGILNRKCNQLARALREKCVKPGTIVGISLERSLEMLVGVFGILKAGGAYLPIVPDSPRERIRYMLSDCNINLLLSQRHLQDKLQVNRELIFLEEEDTYKSEYSNLKDTSGTKDSAYIIYTSGSTGEPKGALIEHGTIVNTLYYRKNYYQFNEKDRFLQIFSFSFDGAVVELFTPLICGSELILVNQQQHLNLDYVSKIIERSNITHFVIIPNFYRTFLQEIPESLKSLRVVTVAGENFSEELVKEHFEKLNHVRLTNEYGPTENSVCSTVYEFSREKTKVSIGKTINNVMCYMLDKNEQLSPVSVPGELCLSGLGLSRGYLNRPALTAERFTHLTLGNKHLRLYKTGDIGRWLSDGNIEFLMRIDHQVKIRGFRIELGEIESCYLKHKDIREAVVIAKEIENGDNYLCVYYTSKKELDPSHLREYLSNNLPNYMIPSSFVWLEEIPLTSNGKVDRKALPYPEVGAKNSGYSGPRDELDEIMIEIWAEVLNLPKDIIGIGDDFLKLGGHSLKAIRLSAKVYERLNIRLPLAEIFNTSNIMKLSDYLRTAVRSEYVSIEPTEEKEYYALSSAQRRLYIMQQFSLTLTAYNIPTVVKIEGKLDICRLKEVFKELVDRHENFRTSFDTIREEPVQLIHNEVHFEIERPTIADQDEHAVLSTEQPIQMSRVPLIINDFIRPFNLSQAPLMRTGVIKTGESAHILIVDMHHIISDGVSQRILVKDFLALYDKRELPGLKLHYKDYSQWQNEDYVRESVRLQKRYWINKFAGEVPLLELVSDYPRPPVKHFEGKRINFVVEEGLTRRLHEMTKKTGTTLFMVLMAAFYILIARYTSQEDIVVGTPVTGRRHTDLQNVVGMFVNMLALRNRPKRNKKFIAFLKEVKREVLEAVENQDYQFEELIIDLKLNRTPNRNPLFDVVFTLEDINSKDDKSTRAGNLSLLQITPYEFEEKMSPFDLLMFAMNLNGKLQMYIEYSTVLFKQSTIDEMANYYKDILSQVVENNNIELREIKLSHQLEEIESDSFLEDGKDFAF